MTAIIRDLRTRAKALARSDRERLLRRLGGAAKIADAERRTALLDTLAGEIADAEVRQALRRAARPKMIDYPDELPITDRRDELLATIRDHQVVIVAGETGSGKSTQLPKLCLELGRGVDGLIGHTQPRRIAARSIAERVASELGSSVGGLVGYTVRFSDQVGDGTLIKLMTDGILLAETHRDRRLNRYDTIILDEAHERSLNIDFLLGYLKGLLPRRPDLKLIVTSATIDTERFSEHFGGAPIIEVSGRTYPVEMRYRPLEDPASPEPRDQPQGICDAILELMAGTDGDVLVFCSGEREIRDAADALHDLNLRHTEILPLFARLSAAEQHRVFQPHTGRRIVLATNVAETSLTVPGIRAVVDPGTARISRYSRRTKVQRLPIEPISQASANQRAGRCGRLGPGICIRLYDENDFETRPEFTDPEIQRTNLASVILQMAALGLGDIEAFPFLDPPDSRTIRDGISLLDELGAVDPSRQGSTKWLTPLGRKLAKFPLDLRLGRMVIEAAKNGCLREVLVIAAALSIQDPRERPRDDEVKTKAEQLHARFRDEHSDFIAWLNLWNYIHTERRARTSNQFRRLCRDEYLNYKRVREWQDIYGQLREVCDELGLIRNRRPAGADVIHRSLLAGLLSHVGTKDPDGYDYRGARGSRFWISPGSTLFKRAPDWIMAAELVETSRLWARQVVQVPVDWIEDAGAHLIKRSYSDPWWDAARGSAVARETVTLYGLPLATDRVIQFGRIDPAAARELFIRHALVAGEWETHHEFAARNDAQIEDVLALEAKERRSDLLVVDDVLVAFFDQRLPQDVTSVRDFDRWWRDAKADDPHRLDLAVTDLIDPAAAAPDEEAFPDEWRHGDLALPLEYEFDPASPRDGVTIDVPLEGLDRIDPTAFEWNVPGLREELITALIRSLPKQHRKRFVPVAETVELLLERIDPTSGRLAGAVRKELTELGGMAIPPDALSVQALPAHLRPRFRLVEADGTVVAEGDDLAALKDALVAEARASLASTTHELERTGLTAWSFGELPAVVMVGGGAHQVPAYPALIDEGDTVGVRLLATPGDQGTATLQGTIRLLELNLPSVHKVLGPLLSNEAKLVLRSGPYASVEEWADDCIGSALRGIVADAGGPAHDAVGFDRLLRRARDEFADRVLEVGRTALTIMADVVAVVATLTDMPEPRYDAAVEDIERQLGELVYPGFLTAVGAARVPDVARYVAGIRHRVRRLAEDVAKDGVLMERVHTVESGYERLVELLPPSPGLADLAWALQELRVSLFAQSLGTKGKVSERRIAQALVEIEAGG